MKVGTMGGCPDLFPTKSEMRHEYLSMLFLTACVGSLLADGPAGFALLLLAYWAYRETRKA